jgi:hypothetical protein
MLLMEESVEECSCYFHQFGGYVENRNVVVDIHLEAYMIVMNLSNHDLVPNHTHIEENHDRKDGDNSTNILVCILEGRHL